MRTPALALVAVFLGAMLALQPDVALDNLVEFDAPAPNSPISQTSDRLDSERQEALIGESGTLLDRGDLPGAEAAFGVLLRRAVNKSGPQSVEVADLYSSFAVRLAQGSHDNEALTYFRKAISASEKAFGPDHPETALIWNDLGLTLSAAHGLAGRAEAEAALKEAYRIRLKSLGARNAETAFTLSYLARLYAPRTTGRTPKLSNADLAIAGDYLWRAVSTYPDPPAGRRDDLDMLSRDGMELFIANGRPREAIDIMLRLIASDGKDGFCAGLLHEELLKAGYQDEAKEVRRRFHKRGMYWPSLGPRWPW